MYYIEFEKLYDLISIIHDTYFSIVILPKPIVDKDNM